MRTCCYTLMLLMLPILTITAQQDPPDLTDQFLNGGASTTEVANVTNQLNSPTDLDFNTYQDKKDLWIVNKTRENTGGSTTIVRNLGMSNETIEWEKDGNAWHFMSLPTGIAFGKDGFFATSPGVYDANHNGGAAFTGPTLWSSDPSIYGQDHGPNANGSHMDMLHESPQCQGIAHEKDNVYWVFDGYNGDLVRYDFADDHGPGNDYHADGIVHRYSEESLQKDPNDKVVSHLTIDKSTGWLYAVDYGNQRVIRLDINTGEPGGTPSYGPYEQLAEYKHIVNYTWEEVVTNGLEEPAGIAIVGDRMLISDYATGEIIVFDISSMPATELGRISTEALGIMGITIGPEGYIYYVDHDDTRVYQMTPVSTGIADASTNHFSIAPNPSSNGNLQITNSDKVERVEILDATGKTVYAGSLQDPTVNTGIEQAGVYFVKVADSKGNTSVKKWIIQ